VVISSDGPAFTVPSDFDIEKFRRDHLFQPEAAHPHVELRFDKALAYEVRTRFDPARVQVGRDGSLQVTLENPLSDWLVSWVLGFGAGVEVQEPAELRQKVAERAQAIAALHS
jgi:predicted DNA-binding transcriptional regulator YafY